VLAGVCGSGRTLAPDVRTAIGIGEKIMTKSSVTRLLDANLYRDPPQKSNGHGKDELITVRASDITPKNVQWIWPGRIAVGKQTLMAGEPGVGKSQVIHSIVAYVTAGRKFPCGEGQVKFGNAIILAAEDSLEDTTIPRLDAAGADLQRVHILMATRVHQGGERTFDLQADLILLEQKIAEIGDVSLVCIDPITSYLGNVDSHKNADLRRVLEPVGRMAERARVGIVSVTHFAKPNGNATRALHRFIGSIAFVAAASPTSTFAK
jgi:putative DNA primase/helicase